MTALELLDKEITNCKRSLERALKKPNVSDDEIAKIREKLRLKEQTLRILELVQLHSVCSKELDRCNKELGELSRQAFLHSRGDI